MYHVAPTSSAAPVIRITGCGHERGVSWEGSILHLFLSSERKKAGVGHAWVKNSQSV